MADPPLGAGRLHQGARIEGGDERARARGPDLAKHRNAVSTVAPTDREPPTTDQVIAAGRYNWR
jgi:hypothetical protein